MRALVVSILILVLLAPAMAADRSLVLVQWTDIHYGNEEWDPAAWHRALREGREARPDAVLLTGDNADNKCTPAEFARRTEGFLMRYGPRMRAMGVPVLLTLGNNDLADNYQTDPENLAPVLAAWRRHLGKDFYLDGLGNGTRRFRGMTWISLNSMLFSTNNEYEHRGDQAERAFRWLEAELSRARGPVVLLTHIPPTWDLYGRSPAWEPQYLRRLVEVLHGHPGPALVVAGHFHRNEMHALSLPGGRAVPVFSAGSLSLKYGNQANWRTYQWLLGADGAPSTVRYRVRYPQHPDWDRVYSVDRPFESRTWSDFVSRLASDPTFYRRYMQDLWAHNRDWEKSSLPPESRDAVLQEVWVDTSGHGAEPAGGARLDACCGG